MKLRLLILLTLLTVLLAACNFSLAEDVTPPPDYVPPAPAPTLAPAFPASAPDVNAGAALYAEKCAPCHGPTGQGDGPQAAILGVNVPALGTSAEAAAAIPAQWYNIVTQGNMPKMMPPFTSLSDQQRWDVVAYALSLSTPAEQIQAGKAQYETYCVECHGLDGKLNPKADLTNQESMAQLSLNDLASIIQNGKQPGMEALPLASADAQSVAAYTRTFTLATSQPQASSAPSTEPAPAATPATGTDTASTPNGLISGTVINGSGGSIPTGLKATLHTFEHDLTTQQFNEGKSREATVAPNGRFLFTAVPMTQTSAYFVSIEFSGTTYESSPAVPGQDGQTEYDLPITIFETTTDQSALTISTAHLLLDYSQPGKIQVVEFYIISNPGTQAVVAAQPGQAVLTVSLPKGYQNLQFDSGSLGDRFLQTADGFADTLSIPPTNETSQYSLVFAFDMPYTADNSPLAFLTGQKFELTQAFPLQTEKVNLLIPLGLQAEGSNLTAGKTQEMGGGVTYQLYSSSAIAAGQPFSARISGKPQAAATSASPTTNQNLLIGLGAFGLVLILAGAFLFWRERRTAQADEEEQEEDADLNEDEILDAIIALDDQYKAGNLSEAAYKQRRAQLKARLQDQ